MHPPPIAWLFLLFGLLGAFSVVLVLSTSISSLNQRENDNDSPSLGTWLSCLFLIWFSLNGVLAFLAYLLQRPLAFGKNELTGRFKVWSVFWIPLFIVLWSVYVFRHMLLDALGYQEPLCAQVAPNLYLGRLPFLTRYFARKKHVLFMKKLLLEHNGGTMVIDMMSECAEPALLAARVKPFRPRYVARPSGVHDIVTLRRSASTSAEIVDRIIGPEEEGQVPQMEMAADGGNGDGDAEANEQVFVRYRCVPSLDTMAPKVSELVAAVEEVVDFRRNYPSSCLYIHCVNGHGRSAVFAVCLLCALNIAPSVDAAFREISLRRPSVYLQGIQRQCCLEAVALLRADLGLNSTDDDVSMLADSSAKFVACK